MPGSLCFRKGMRMNIGIYRRIDDLGRIVIPKEVRRQVHLEKGDIMEISVDGRQLILTPYASITDADIIVRACVNGWKKNESMILAVTTKLDIFASTDTNLKQHIMLSEELRSSLTCRKEYITDGTSEIPLMDEVNSGCWRCFRICRTLNCRELWCSSAENMKCRRRYRLKKKGNTHTFQAVIPTNGRIP